MTLLARKRNAGESSAPCQVALSKILSRRSSVLPLSFLLSILLAPFTLIAVAEEQRTWTSADGTRQITGEFIDLKDGSVQLKFSDLSTAQIPLEKFSQADQDYITQAASIGNFAPSEHSASSTELRGEDYAKFAKPDHQTLLKMYYASNDDILKDDFSFAMEVYTTLGFPPLDAKVVGTGGRARMGFDQQWFKTASEYAANEFTRKKFEQQIREKAAIQLANTTDWKPTATFRLRWNVRFGEYEPDSNSFPLISTSFRGLNYSPSTFSGDQLRVPRSYLTAAASKEFGKSQSLAPSFRANFRPSKLLPVEMARNGSSVFKLAVSGLDKLERLPLSPNQAETLLSQLSKRIDGQLTRSLVIEGLVRVGPISIVDG